MPTRRESLARSIEAATTELDRACAKSVLAAYLGRSGQYAAAEDLIAQIRSAPINTSVRLSALVMFAEAMTLLQDKLSAMGVDRLKRGYSLASAASVKDVAALNAAWLFHCSYNLNQYAQMADWLERCRQLSDSLDLDAEARLALTFAAMDRYLGDFAGSDGWYKIARQIAVSLADGPYLSASMYNRAAYGIARLRFLEAARVHVAGRIELLQQLSLEMDSATNYSQATRNASTLHLQLLWTARLKMLEGRFELAVPGLLTSKVDMPEAKHRRQVQLVDADLCLCEAVMGQRCHSVQTRVLASDDLESLETDDRAVYLGQLRAAALVEGDIGLAEALDPRLHAAIAEHEAFLATLGTTVSSAWLRERLASRTY